MTLLPPGTEVFTVSRDLPFAQTRFAEEAMVKTKMGSDYHGGAFGKAFRQHTAPPRRGHDDFDGGSLFCRVPTVR